MIISRRAALLGAAATLTACSSALPDGVPADSPGPSMTGTFASRYRHTEVGWQLSIPPGARRAGLPVLVVLHGRGGSHTSAFDGSLHLDRYLAAAVRSGAKPFAIASVDGGDHEYWHPRSDTDPAGMVVREFVPLLGRLGLSVARIGLLGWSMGGYGALYLSEVLGRSRVAVAVAESPAIWLTAARTVEGAFDDAADFAAHTVFGRVDRLAGIPLMIDCGDRDGFAPITRLLRSRLSPGPAGGITPGGHDSSYWRGRAPSQLAFVARRLA